MAALRSCSSLLLCHATRRGAGLRIWVPFRGAESESEVGVGSQTRGEVYDETSLHTFPAFRFFAIHGRVPFGVANLKLVYWAHCYLEKAEKIMKNFGGER